MEFGSDKIAKPVIKSRKRSKKIELKNPKDIGRLGEKENNKYLAVLEAETIKQRQKKKTCTLE